MYLLHFHELYRLYIVACLKLRKNTYMPQIAALELFFFFSLLCIKPSFLWPQVPSPGLTDFHFTSFTRLLGSVAAG